MGVLESSFGEWALLCRQGGLLGLSGPVLRPSWAGGRPGYPRKTHRERLEMRRKHGAQAVREYGMVCSSSPGVILGTLVLVMTQADVKNRRGRRNPEGPKEPTRF